MKKFLYIFFGILFFVSFAFSYLIISDKYDKQNKLVLIIKEIVPVGLKNKLRNTIYKSRASLNEKEIQKLQFPLKDMLMKGEQENIT